MGLFENTSQDLNYKAMEVDTSSLSQTQYINSNSIYRGDVRVDVYDLDDEADSHYKATDTLTAEDLEFFIGKMSDKEYADFVKEIENYYGNSIKSYEQLLSNAEETLKLLNDSKALEMSAVDYLDQNAIGGRKDEIMNQLYLFVQDKKYEGTGVTREELENMTEEEKVQYIIKYDEEAKRIYDEWMKAKTEVADEYIKSKFKDLGITTLDEYIKCRNTLIDKKENMKEAIKTTKNLKQSAYYDNLKYLSDYNNYKEHEFTDEERDYVKKKSYTSPTMNDSYDYNDFHNKFPDTTPLDFVKLLQETHPSGNYTVTGIKDLQNLKTIANACDKIPDLSKTYEYLYSQSPEKAGEYLKDIQYELNNIEGQLRAERFLSLLGESDGNDDVLEIIANELGVTVEGLTDGLESFGSGVGYSFEALLTSLGITEENRTMSAEEYKKMYILYGLLDEESKIKTGLLTKNDNGQLENTNPNSIIDYTKTYSGGITLKWNYEISQGIGNMIPSIAISYACPIAGSIAMGVSAGGNAYHDAMVNGDSLFSSIMYGVFTGTSEAITERILGGLPGLSDVQVTSLATYAKACVSEGFQESFQGVMDAVYRASFMGEELPTTLEGWEEFGKDILKQGVYGAITAGIMQSPSFVMSKYDINVNGLFSKSENNNSSVFKENISEKQRNEYNNLIQNFNLEKNPCVYYAKLLNNIDLNDSNNYVKALAVFDVYSDELGNISDILVDKSRIIKDFLKKANELYNKKIISETDLDFYKARVASVRNNYINKYYNFIEDAINKNSLYNAKFDSKNKTYTMLGLESNSVYKFNFETSFGSKFSINFVTDESSNPKVLGVFDGLDLDSELELLQRLVGYSEQGELQLVSTAKISNVNEKCKYNNNNPNVAALSFMNSFGLDQGVFTHFDNLELSKSNFRKAYEYLLSNKGISMNKIYENVFDIVRKYKPGISDGDIAKYIKKINSTGACSYAAVLNDIIMQYNGKESDFKQIFGYDLYEKDFFGNKRLNSECLLVDFYTFVNMTNRSLFGDNSTYLDPESHDDQYYVTNSIDGVKTDIIQDFLNYKISNCDSKETIDNYDGYSIKIKRSEYIDYLSYYDEETPKKSIYESITAGMDNGEHFTIGVHVDHYSGNELKMYKYNNDSGKFDISYSTTSWIDNSSDLEGGLGNNRYDGHAMAIVAIDINGLYVESWGEPYFIPYTSLDEIKYKISGFKIELQKGD